MTARDKVLVLGCSDDTIEAMGRLLDRKGGALLVVDSISELTRQSISSRPVMIVLGVSLNSSSDLEAIGVIHAVRDRMPIVVVAEEDSLDLERRAREMNIFYYLVEPVQIEELEAVIDDSFRYTRSC